VWIRHRGKIILPERSDNIFNEIHELSCGTEFMLLFAYCTPESSGMPLYRTQQTQNIPRKFSAYMSKHGNFTQFWRRR
ncbi:hypothetical protein ACQWHU_26430, partial [Salmonella enterica subsp. enterica serovar Infantis]